MGKSLHVMVLMFAFGVLMLQPALSWGGRQQAKPRPSPSPTPTPTPTPSPTPSGFSDNFSSYSTGVCFNDGSIFGSWTSVFSGFGCNSVVNTGSGNALQEQPQTSVSPGETHASLVIGPSFAGNFTYQVSMKTVQQLRQGSSPNTWEVAWAMWNYADNTHFYYFIPKPNGWELGKGDPAYPGAQRFLATGSSPTFPIGSWYNVKIVQNSNTMSVYVNGSLITSFTDTQSPYTGGNIGLYNEDSLVQFKAVSVTQP